MAIPLDEIVLAGWFLECLTGRSEERLYCTLHRDYRPRLTKIQMMRHRHGVTPPTIFEMV